MSKYDVIVIGAGPGGYIAAIKAAQMGFKVACVDKAPAFGGTCLRVGCIPSKALLESSELYHQAKSNFKRHGIKTGGVELNLKAMMRRKDQVVTTLTKGIAGLFQKNKVEGLFGTAKIVAPGKVLVTDSEGGEKELEAERILIATGSDVASLPGIEIDGEHVISSTQALELSKVPEHLVVIGAGAIGLEMASVWCRLGAKVTVLEYLDRILPGMDKEIAGQAMKILKRQGLDFHLGKKVTGVSVADGRCSVSVEGQDPIEGDKVLMAVGRRPYTSGLGLEELGVKMDQRGFVEVDHDFQTNVKGVYAIGDVIGGAMLAHKAEEEGIAVIEQWAQGYGHVDADLIPAIVYTDPEVAMIGKTEEQLKESGVDYKKGAFPFAANGRARAIMSIEGSVKVLADAKTDRILGVHIVGPHAGDLIAEATAAMSFGASSEDVARTCHAHPTLSEAFKEASLAVQGETLNC